MILLAKKDIQEIFSMKDAIEAVKVAFTLFSQGKSEVPLRTQIVSKKNDGTFLFMPAYVADLGVSSVKIVNIFPKNIDEGLPTAPAQVLLIDGETGMFKAMLDGTYLTQLRTGAASGVALEVLSRKGAKEGALIGTGGQAATQLEAMINVRKLDVVRVFDVNFERTKAFCEKMTQQLIEYKTQIVPAKSSDEAIENADVIICVTPSTKPVFDATKVKEGATISCVGSYQHHMQELDPKVFERSSKLYFDSEKAVLSESGDILIPLEQGLITEKDFTGEIGDVLLNNLVGRETDEEIIVFKTVGIGTQDLVTAEAIYEKAIKNDVGTIWDSRKEKQ